MINQVVSRRSSARPIQIVSRNIFLRRWFAALKVQKVYGTLARTNGLPSNVKSAQFAARLGCSIGELAVLAGPVVGATATSPIVTAVFAAWWIRFRRTLANAVLQRHRRSLGGEAPPPLRGSARWHLDAIAAKPRCGAICKPFWPKLKKETGPLAISGRYRRARPAPCSPAGSLRAVSSPAPPRSPGPLGAGGRMLRLIVARYPPIIRSLGPSLAWLIQFHASGEAAWRIVRL